MFNSSRIVAARNALLAAALFATAAPTFAQAPTDAQKSAIRSACRADYQAHCASVTPGGAEALQCLNKNMSSLSSACQSAVRAIEPVAAPKTEAAPAAPKAESAPATEPAKPAATTEAPKAETPKAAAAKQPSSAQVSAIKSACRSDYPKVCAGVPPGGAPALECLEKNKAKVSPTCAKAVSAATGGGGAPAAAAPAGAAPAAAAPAAAPTVIVLRPLRPREELLIVRSACGGDVRTLCAGVAPGGGRIAQCLATNAASLSPACKEVLAPFAAR
ncbi:cysteine rich repeat-containing protein [Bradyrhizobium sp. CCGUVB1N3]|uniref:cysteine rich repeat-containing protein n=1 Tax=Bradyrhizobium sp. CCGUVB1N3 TaxID=2949629 RepID=UPI0020B27FAA|nr:cysteine rich repeat-containing protein [Bradyrhizobium sp. CCGUVB1N3]MCP3474134.1 cysteine rich repeat-containing protein [Bradyrhizobium sp. CCGUVB1N3]